MDANWSELTRLVCADSVLSSTQREEYLSLLDRKDPDEREASMARRSFYPYLRNTLYPRLRTVDFDFYLSRRWMQKDTVHTTVLDSLYMSGVQAIKDREYQKAIEILSPYDDFNTAVALSAADRDWTALDVLGRQKESDKTEYLSALLYSRVGEDALAVQHYLKSCALNPSYVHRGNLDPEISSLISKYNLNNDL